MWLGCCTDQKSHLKKPRFPKSKCGVLPWQFIHLDLPESGLQVQAWKMASTDQAFKCLLDPWQWIGVLLHVGFKMAEVYAKAQTPIFLPNQYHSITPCTLAGAYHAWIQHLLQVCMPLLPPTAGGIHLNHSLNEASSVTLITCLVERVQPSLQGSKEKMLWYSAKRDHAESASSGGQDPNPLKI